MSTVMVTVMMTHMSTIHVDRLDDCHDDSHVDRLDDCHDDSHATIHVDHDSYVKGEREGCQL